MNKRKYKYFYWLFPMLWMAVIYYFSDQPYEQQNIQPYLAEGIDLDFIKPYINWVSFTYHQSVVSVGTLGVYGFVEFFIRKGAHVFVFFVLNWLFYLALHQTMKFPFIYRIMISFVCTVLYAVFDEFHQSFTENRTSYVGDVFLDGLGGTLAIIVLIIMKNVSKNKSTK